MIWKNLLRISVLALLGFMMIHSALSTPSRLPDANTSSGSHVSLTADLFRDFLGRSVGSPFAYALIIHSVHFLLDKRLFVYYIVFLV